MFTNNQINSFNKSKKDFVNKNSKANLMENHIKLSKEAKPFMPEYIIFDDLKDNSNQNKTKNEKKPVVEPKNKPEENLNDANSNCKSFLNESAIINSININNVTIPSDFGSER